MPLKPCTMMTEALRLAFFDRNTYLGDPAFVQAPLNRLLSKDYAARLRGTIGDRATSSASLGPAVAAAGGKAGDDAFLGHRQGRQRGCA